MSASPMIVFTREGETLRSLSVDADISIGRGEGNIVRLEDRAVSRKHAIVRKTPEGVQIEKQSDFAPIRLNGIECTRAFLKEGDVVDIGPFRMRLDAKKSVKHEERAPASPLLSVDEGKTRVLGPEESNAFSPDAAFPPPEALPTEENPGASDGHAANVFGDLTSELGAAPSLALPIEPDGKGAELGSVDPGTNIFSAETNIAEVGGAGPLDIGFNLEDQAPDSGPAEVSISFNEEAQTRIAKSGIDARLDIPDGMANVKSLDLDREEIYIGRGKECDIVLNDKKSSRKNSVIVRVGNRYVVRDLDSSNGTYVNGEAIKEHELSADDLIRVGECEIHFVALNPEYERKKDSFLPVDSGPSADPIPTSAPFAASFNEMGLPADTPYPAQPIPTSGAMGVGPAARTGIWGAYDKYFKNFGSLRPLQKLLVVLAVGLFLSWYFEDELGLGEKPQVQRKSPQTTDGKAVVIKDYDRLPPEKKAQIDEAVRKATDFLRQMDYDKAIYEVQQKVFPILPDYSQAKEIERYAQEGKRRKDAIAEEARKKEEEEKLRAQIADLEKQTRDLMTARKYEEAKEVFSDILALDPENALVSDWKKEIEAWMEEQARMEQERLVQEEINKRAWDMYREAYDLHKAGKFRDAVVIYKKVPELGSSDDGLIKKVKTMIRTCQDSIRDLREPHLAKAKELEAASDMAGAFKEYQAATEIDPPHPTGWAGMERIRDVLNDHAKVLYTEAVIAESYSDFKTAKEKFGEIMKMAPDGSLYYQRAQRKLQSYLNFKSEEEVPTP